MGNELRHLLDSLEAIDRVDEDVASAARTVGRGSAKIASKTSIGRAIPGVKKAAKNKDTVDEYKKIIRRTAEQWFKDRKNVNNMRYPTLDIDKQGKPTKTGHNYSLFLQSIGFPESIAVKIVKSINKNPNKLTESILVAENIKALANAAAKYAVDNKINLYKLNMPGFNADIESDAAKNDLDAIFGKIKQSGEMISKAANVAKTYNYSITKFLTALKKDSDDDDELGAARYLRWLAWNYVNIVNKNPKLQETEFAKQVSSVMDKLPSDGMRLRVNMAAKDDLSKLMSKQNVRYGHDMSIMGFVLATVINAKGGVN